MPRIAPQPVTKVNAERLLKLDLKRNQDRAQARKDAKHAEAVKATAARMAAEAIAQSKLDELTHKNALAALMTAKADAEATGTNFLVMCEQMGIDPITGHVVVEADKPRYNGPMLALVTARKTYVKAANGIQCNGDELAVVCGAYEREHTVRALIVALKLPGNPYTALNPGQQSMNLRNKARYALKAGTLKLADVKAAYEVTKA